jgi:hypothetical protein
LQVELKNQKCERRDYLCGFKLNAFNQRYSRVFVHQTSAFTCLVHFMMMKKILLFISICLATIQVVIAQQPTAPEGPSTTAAAVPEADSVMVTIILKHQQDKNLPEIRRILEAQGFWDIFPPDDARVVSWTLAMGLGHVITMNVPAGAVRRLNLALENGAWGAFDTEIYLTYDYKSVWNEYIERREDAKEDRN